MRAAIYTRISDDREGKGAGVARQESECRQLADRLGMEVVKVYSDNSISAFKGKVRPAYREMIEAVKNGEVDVVIAWANDRLTRSPRELEDLVDVLDASGVKVQTVTSGALDLSTADGRASARIVGVMARQESEKKSERIKAQKRQATARGDANGGQRPYGWTSARKAFVPEEIAVVREVGERVLRGEGISTIVTDLNKRGIKSVSGGQWSRTSLRTMLTNPATAGLRLQPDGGVIQGKWEGAWDKATWDRICGLLLDPTRKTTHRLRSYVLIGLLEDESGRKLRSGFSSENGRRYRTDTAGLDGRKVVGGVTISADFVEGIVSDLVRGYWHEYKLVEPEVEKSSQADEIQAELDLISEMYGKGELTAGEWNAARGPLKARLNQARKAEAPKADLDWATKGALDDEWADLTVQQQRTVIESVVERVVIGPAKAGASKNDPERVKVVWR